MKTKFVRITALILAMLIIFSTFSSCRDVNVGDVDVGDVDVGGLGNGSGNNSGEIGETTTYTVTFNSWDGSVLKVQSGIKKGESAIAPEAPMRDGYTFIGWDRTFDNVTESFTVTATYKIGIIESVGCEHNSVYFEARAASCTVDGNIEYWYCEKCDKYFGDEDLSTEIKKADTIIDKFGHNVVIDEAVAPTYEKEGLTEGSHCSVCGVVLVEQIEIAPLLPEHYSVTYRNGSYEKDGENIFADFSLPIISSEYTDYSNNIGMLDLPIPTVVGYKFEGWYTKQKGGEEVSYIDANSGKNFVLFAHWSLVEYKITYRENINGDDVPNNKNPLRYTIIDEILLVDAEWSGLLFTGWSLGRYDDENRTSITKILKGTTGDLEITAEFKQNRNIAVQKTDATPLLTEIDSDSGLYYFIYELGTIQRVVLSDLTNEGNYFYKNINEKKELSESKTLALSQASAENISYTVANSVTQTEEWSKTLENALSSSASLNWSVSSEIGSEVGAEAFGVTAKVSAKVSETLSGGWSIEGSTKETTVNGGSYSDTTENSKSVSSTIEYKTENQVTYQVTTTIDANLPNGYYAFVHAGDVKVFAVAIYDINNRTCNMITYSVVSAPYPLTLYARNSEELNSRDCEPLNYTIPMDKIEELVNQAYCIDYELTTDEGVEEENITNPNSKVFINTGANVLSLGAPTYSTNEYKFIGWYADEDFNIAVNDAWLQNWNKNPSNVTLYAKWEQVYKREGDNIYFGSWPQSEVTETSLVATLNSKAGALPVNGNNADWTSYKYYIEGSNTTDFMWYKDIEHNGGKYRAVYFTSYRPYNTYYNSTDSHTYQDDNGYTTSTLYLFKWESVKWDILTEEGETALLICDMLLDAQAYQNCCINDSGDYYATDDVGNILIDKNGNKIYANNYAYSTIRVWLSETFYETAFTDMQKSIIQMTEIDNSAESTDYSSNSYACENTKDEVFLLSFAELTNDSYGFSNNNYEYDEYRQKKTTDYAQCQGAYAYIGDTYNVNGFWLLRSPSYNNSYYVLEVYYYGAIAYDAVPNPYYGICPALWIKL